MARPITEELWEWVPTRSCINTLRTLTLTDFPGGTSSKEHACQCRSAKKRGFESQEDPLQKGMAIHSSVLICRIPWTEEPGGLQSVGSHSQTQLKQFSTHTCMQMVKRVRQIHTGKKGHEPRPLTEPRTQDCRANPTRQ